jgi:hypothetical protein
MTTTTPDRLVNDYLKQLQTNGRSLPRSSRNELVQQIQDHLQEAAPIGSAEAEVRTAIDQLGDPCEIIAEEFDRLGIRPASAGKLEWAVVFLLPLGGIVIPILGWILAVILLWASRVWTTREKLIGTLLVPGGLSSILFLNLIVGAQTCTSGGSAGHQGPQHCTGTPLPNFVALALMIAFVIAGIATPIFLARRATASRK